MPLATIDPTDNAIPVIVYTEPASTTPAVLLSVFDRPVYSIYNQTTSSYEPAVNLTEAGDPVDIYVRLQAAPTAPVQVLIKLMSDFLLKQ